MNTIYKKNTKRKYVRKPLCANLSGICEFNHCRCNYPLIQPETRARIDEYLHHRQRAIKRRKEVEMAKLDNENWNDMGDGTRWAIQNTPRYKGYIPPRKFNYWVPIKLIIIFILAAVGYVAIISLIDILK